MIIEKERCRACKQIRITCLHGFCETCDWPGGCFAKIPRSQAGDTACTLLLIFAGFSLAVIFTIYFALTGFGELSYVLKELFGMRRMP